MKKVFVMLLGLGLIASIAAVGCRKPNPVEPPLQRGSIVKTLPDGHFYFVTYVGSQGADLIPCIGEQCPIRAWSAERLQTTVHFTVYPSDSSYGDVLTAFAKQLH
jgi:hypothetical protein